MVLARVADFFTTGEPAHNLVEEGRRDVVDAMANIASSAADTAKVVAEEIEDDEGRPPYLHVRSLERGLGRPPLTFHRQCWQEVLGG